MRVGVINELTAIPPAHITNTVLGIFFSYRGTQPAYPRGEDPTAAAAGLAYYSISFALNIILTLMVVVRLVLHSRNIRNAMGTQSKAGGLYNVIVTILVESSALYSVTFISYIVPWAIPSGVQFIFLPILAGAQVSVIPTISLHIVDHRCEQVIGPFLIVLRVASQRALTSETIVSEHIGSIRFQSQRTTGGDLSLSDEHPMTSTDNDEETTGGSGTIAEMTFDSRREGSGGSA